jgi:uncharacterized repeat protein (TIGR03806 family)
MHSPLSQYRVASLAILVVFLVSCADASPSRDALHASDPERVSSKGGLDEPAVAVGPFLDGMFPRNTPGSLPGSQWASVDAFPGINLQNTIVLASNPGDDRIYASSQDGLIVSFQNDPSASTTVPFLDLRDRVAVVFEGGLLGMAFHPESGEPSSPHRNWLYVYYSSHCPLNASKDAPDLTACDDSYPTTRTAGFFGAYLRLSRFEVSEVTGAADPMSEQVLLNFRINGGVHRGGGLAIRDNGRLFLSIGDQDDAQSAQSTADNFNGSVLRIDVNVTEGPGESWVCAPGSHLPRRIFGRSDEVSGRHYCIPDDNPWLDPSGSLLEEYCAVGLRNPFRLSVDSVSQRVWVGDVGSTLREEVDVIECGNNYGWPFREGFTAGPGSEPSAILGILTDPIVDFVRQEASSITGGVVYRGSRLAELYGLYIVGDFRSDRLWAVALDETTMTGTKTELGSFRPGNLVSFAEDNDGEVYYTDIYSSGSIYQLDRVGDPQPDAPALLSATGAFSSMVDAKPSPFWVPYQLNQPFWSDGALKFRYIALPNDGVRDSASEKVAFSVDGDWKLPTGTVLMKHFELPLDETDSSRRTRLETRFMILGDDDVWYGLTYRWRPDQLEADLLTTEATATYSITEVDGAQRQQAWYFPARSECLSCHRDGAGGALGLKTHQLNGDFEHPSTGRTDNQLVTWDALGMFSPSPGSPSSLPRAPSYPDVTAPLQDRVRSWLDSNCGYCHRPDQVNAGFDLRFTTAFDQQSLLWTPVREDLGNPGTVVVYPGNPSLSALWQRSAAIGDIAMPPLAKALPEDPAVALLGAWIERLPNSSPNLPPVLSNPGSQTTALGQQVAVALSAADGDSDDVYFDADGLPEGLEIDHDSGTISGVAVEPGVHLVTLSASDGPEVEFISIEWTVTDRGGLCGDGTLDPGEGCDDGNNVNGDGCSSTCNIVAALVCGDGFLTGAEECDPPVPGICAGDCTLQPQVCGDGFLTPPEECEDGNTVDGDGCSSACIQDTPELEELTSLGSIIAAVPDAHFGTWDIEEIRDGIDTEYDTWDGVSAAAEDWIGYEFSSDHTFGLIVFWEGTHFGNGGWFDTLTVQVRQSGVWNEVSGLVITPAYPGNNGVSGETFDMTFAPISGDAIRIYGDPGGSANFISVAELRVFAQAALRTCGNAFLDADEECDDGNNLRGDGCDSSCRAEPAAVCGDGIVTPPEICEPPGVGICSDSCDVSGCNAAVGTTPFGVSAPWLILLVFAARRRARQ